MLVDVVLLLVLVPVRPVGRRAVVAFLQVLFARPSVVELSSGE